MIETIYSNESGDAGMTGKVQTPFKMPKNIRQVGKGNTIKKIYAEDYVMSYIKQLSGNDYSGFKIAVLLGQCIRLDNCRNIFVSGGLEVKEVEHNGEIIFSNDTWTKIYEDIKKYFVDAEIVGWFIGGPGYLMEDEEKILKIHIANFAGQDKVLLTYDNVEKEEAFFGYENNHLTKQEGYYIYYEKNEAMQNYMIESREEISGEVSYEDKVSKDIRTVLQNKKLPEEDNKSVTRLMYAAGTLLAVIILVVGAAMLSNYDKMKSMQNTMEYLSKNMEQMQAMVTGNKSESNGAQTGDSSDEGTTSKEQSLNVEVVPGEVQPLDDAEEQSGAENNDAVKDSDKKDSNNEDSNNEDSNKDSNKDNKNNEDSNTDDDIASDSKDGNTDTTIDTSKSDVQKDTTDKEVKETVSDQVKYYTVQTGDTLADISYKLYHTYTKVKSIMKLNNINDQDIIYVGQKLIVP